MTIVAALMAGCGGGDAQEPASEPGQEASSPAAPDEEVAKGTVEVKADDPLFYTPTTIAAGPTTFTFVNEGRIEHELRLVVVKKGLLLSDVAKMPLPKIKKNLTELGIIPKLKAGQEAPTDLKLNLKPGAYGMICLIQDAGGAPHSKRGMFKEFEVVDL
jgi:hypothetical protein